VRRVIVDEITTALSDTAIIAQSRAAIVDVRAMIANSLDRITETKHLIKMISDDLISIKLNARTTEG
jgi:hypothetical protein